MHDTEKYKELIKEINESARSNTSVEVSDRDLLASINNFKKEEDFQCRARNMHYTKLLDQYINTYKSKSNWNKWYKFIFFILILGAFAILVLFCSLSIYHISLKKTVSISDLGTIAGGASGVMTSIIIIPRIIAEHLFPKDEDTNMINMVRSMQENDAGIRKLYSNREP